MYVLCSVWQWPQYTHRLSTGGGFWREKCQESRKGSPQVVFYSAKFAEGLVGRVNKSELKPCLKRESWPSLLSPKLAHDTPNRHHTTLFIILIPLYAGLYTSSWCLRRRLVNSRSPYTLTRYDTLTVIVVDNKNIQDFTTHSTKLPFVKWTYYYIKF